MKHLALLALIAVPRPALAWIATPRAGWRRLFQRGLLWLSAAAVFVGLMSIYLFGGDY